MVKKQKDMPAAAVLHHDTVSCCNQGDSEAFIKRRHLSYCSNAVCYFLQTSIICEVCTGVHKVFPHLTHTNTDLGHLPIILFCIKSHQRASTGCLTHTHTHTERGASAGQRRVLVLFLSAGEAGELKSDRLY